MPDKIVQAMLANARLAVNADEQIDGEVAL